MTNSDFTLELALSLFESENKFSVDFDTVWRDLGYSRKDSAKRFFVTCGFVKNVDYRIEKIAASLPQGGTASKEIILLSNECFQRWKSACMLIKQSSASLRVLTEYQISKNLHKKLGGQREVITEVGTIDILTKTQIIEVKNVKGWKGGVGQVIIYGDCYPSHEKRLHLFGHANSKTKELIEERCLKHGIIVTWES